MNSRKWLKSALIGGIALALNLTPSIFAETDPVSWLESNTDPLDWEGDIASRLVDKVDAFLLDQIEKNKSVRRSVWIQGLTGNRESNQELLTQARASLKAVLGIRDEDRAPVSMAPIVTLGSDSVILEDELLRAGMVRWPALDGVNGEGLLIEPRERSATATIIISPDAEQSPEDWLGLTGDLGREAWWVRKFVESGGRIIVPGWISREVQRRQSPSGGWGADLTHREFLYRPAFTMGRTLVGYETQKLLALIDWANATETGPVGLIGFGEGGYLGMMAAALHSELDVVLLSGVFGPRESQWQEPLDRNLFALLKTFSSAELLNLFRADQVLIEHSQFPKVHLEPGRGGAPADLVTPTWESISDEWEYARILHSALKEEDPQGVGEIRSWSSGENGSGSFGGVEVGLAFAQALFGRKIKIQESESCMTFSHPSRNQFEAPAAIVGREKRQIEEMDRYTQRLMHESPYRRKAFLKNINTDSLAEYETSVVPYRDYFKNEIIGWFGDPDQPFHPRLRKIYDTQKLIGYEVVLDVWEEVFAYGILMIPKDLRMTEKRPVVVCQHGLEGRPQDVADPESDHYAYHRYAAKLTEAGYITFSPQNIYIFQDRFRTLQRKANSIGRTLFSIITPQHQQIVDWLQSLPFVDSDRVAFYGLSYGGKTAMRVPAIVTDYCLSICSADFNDWVWKNASTRSPYSYVWSGEYEIFEFNLAETFNYSEMAALIAPRPFMVERGHFDGVAPDETVAYEFAKVRNLYQARLGIGERTEIEWFVGPHTINGVGTFEFLDRWLDWEDR